MSKKVRATGKNNGLRKVNRQGLGIPASGDKKNTVREEIFSFCTQRDPA
jgi:hypothetical protein